MDVSQGMSKLRIPIESTVLLVGTRGALHPVMLSKIAFSLSLLLAACVTTTADNAADPAEPNRPATFDEVLDLEVEILATLDRDGACPIVDQEGPCAHACDGEIAAYVPAGTCVTLACHRSDGSFVRTGGCNFEAPSYVIDLPLERQR